VEHRADKVFEQKLCRFFCGIHPVVLQHIKNQQPHSREPQQVLLFLSTYAACSGSTEYQALNIMFVMPEDGQYGGNMQHVLTEQYNLLR
jgi:hypothetical protein